MSEGTLSLTYELGSPVKTRTPWGGRSIPLNDNMKPTLVSFHYRYDQLGGNNVKSSDGLVDDQAFVAFTVRDSV